MVDERIAHAADQDAAGRGEPARADDEKIRAVLVDEVEELLYPGPLGQYGHDRTNRRAFGGLARAREELPEEATILVRARPDDASVRRGHMLGRHHRHDREAGAREQCEVAGGPERRGRRGGPVRRDLMDLRQRFLDLGGP